MKTVKAKYSFDHHGMRKRGTEFDVSDEVAGELSGAGLVTVSDPTPINETADKPKAGKSKKQTEKT